MIDLVLWVGIGSAVAGVLVVWVWQKGEKKDE